MQKVLIIGVSGQDGSYLAELLLSKAYEVHGIIRRSSNFNTQRIDHIYEKLHLHYGDLSDGMAISSLIAELKPDEIYNLGAQSHVKVSFEVPEYTANVGALGTLRLLEAVRKHSPESRVYNASSSEMFGSTPPPQHEGSLFSPQSPYAVSKVFAHDMCKLYRKAYGLFIANGILYNHESPRRGETFVTRKITKAAARIKYGLQNKLRLGNLDARRDWGHSKDFVVAMWMMLQHHEPDDFVIATGESWSVREFAQKAFAFIDTNCEDYIEIDQRYFRPAEVDALLGDATKAREVLGWESTTTFGELVIDMMVHDLRDAWSEAELVRLRT